MSARRAAPANATTSGSVAVDAWMDAHPDWRGALLREIRALIRAAAPAIEEDVKWRKPSNPHGVPVWSQDGLVCTGEVYKDKVKVTFAYGAALPDPKRLFNASLDAGTRRAIDLRSGESFNAKAFSALVKAAVARNASA
jgi:hypothetical protein